MASGDIVINEAGVFGLEAVSGSTLLKTAMQKLNLTTATDKIFMIPIAGQIYCGTIEREV